MAKTAAKTDVTGNSVDRAVNSGGRPYIAEIIRKTHRMPASMHFSHVFLKIRAQMLHAIPKLAQPFFFMAFY
ncbi:MAG TPA: hypothetical protein VGU61_16035 [Noviherbaspirillum sp.]|uniref:hypothetical protein n=1 Tax=Noviherbaspirillum sp. TaxID=1926288 RepID=UPI002DDD1B34|nr:hypothetical protein [Noviherbaspirillum sp.]HEV2611778.1 hypothetical protein [Noviherbaspirillum sp.]